MTFPSIAPHALAERLYPPAGPSCPPAFHERWKGAPALIAALALVTAGCQTGADSGALTEIQSNGSGRLNIRDACAFGDVLSGRIDVREASAAAEVAIRRIVDHTGLPSNFVVLEADIDNAVATVVSGERVVIYDPDLLAGSDWTALGLVAHEVGHHLGGHTLRSSGRMDDELDADAFAGFVLARMGATASEAQAVMDLIADVPSLTHPPKADRVRAVRRGWARASEQTDRRADPVTPPPIPDYGYDEVTLDQASGGEPRSMTACSFQSHRGTVVQAETIEADGYPAVYEITLDLDGPGRLTVPAHQDDIFSVSRVEQSWFYEIAREGRRIELEVATCGSGAFESVYRVRAL